MTQKYDCPDCEGSGEWDVMTSLSWNGNSSWRTERCERCNGTGNLDEMDFTDEELETIKGEMK